MSKQKIVVLTGAGISAESGIKTFRDAGGLWEGYNFEEVATPEAFARDPELVLRFYNERRKQAIDAQPNAGHTALKELEDHYEVSIITQNIDDLHEKAGSTKVIHLHGEITKARSSGPSQKMYDWPKDINMGDLCEEGYQLRPHVVWFGEPVPMMEVASAEARTADIFMVVGTSLLVYPAAGLIHFTEYDIPKYIIDPKTPQVQAMANIEFIRETAATGTPKLVQRLIEEAQSL